MLVCGRGIVFACGCGLVLVCGCGLVVCMWVWCSAVAYVGVIFFVLHVVGTMFLDECQTTNKILAIFDQVQCLVNPKMLEIMYFGLVSGGMVIKFRGCHVLHMTSPSITSSKTIMLG